MFCDECCCERAGAVVRKAVEFGFRYRYLRFWRRGLGNDICYAEFVESDGTELGAEDLCEELERRGMQVVLRKR